MENEQRDKALILLGDIVKRIEPDIKFSILEIGAVPVLEKPEPFHLLLDIFPGSKVIAFEVDEDLCDKQNVSARSGMKFYPVALGNAEETREFYETEHPMCSSLYKPNEDFLRLYNCLDVAYIKKKNNIDTVSLDHFMQSHDIGTADFIKIDIQGAELDVFKGGINTIRDIVAIRCEVEFVPLYENQPLFGDVCQFLDKHGIMFHKFFGLSGRTLRPIVLRDDEGFATQHMWSDAMFIRNIFKVPEMTSLQLLKLAVFSFMYGSLDLTYFCFDVYDKRHGTNLNEALLKIG